MTSANPSATRVGALVAGLAALLFPVAAGAQIRIIRKSGTVELASEIVKDTVTEFTYKIRGNAQPQSLAPSDVARIVLENPPELYARGLEMVARGEYDNATSVLNKLLADEKDPILRPYVLYHLAGAYLEWGSSDPASPYNRKATELAEKFLDEFPDSRLQPHVRLLLGRAALQAGHHDESEQIFSELENEARAKFGQDWEIRAKYWGARNLESKGNYGEARNLYASLAATVQRALETLPERSVLVKEYRRLQSLGIARQGACLVAGGKLEEAERFYRDLKRTAERKGDRNLLPGALNGLGEVYLAQGKIREARFQFAIVFVKYFHVPEETLRALFRLGECHESLVGMEPGARERAAAFFREVIDRSRSAHLHSAWAQKAKKKA